MLKKLIIYTDGGARGNPGPAAIGIIIFHGKEIIKQYKKCIGFGTNNQAEYTALLKAIELAKEFGAEELEVYSDSELMIRQLHGKYKVKNKKLQELFQKVKEKETEFAAVHYKHVLRTNPGIVLADELVNKALDGCD